MMLDDAWFDICKEFCFPKFRRTHKDWIGVRRKKHKSLYQDCLIYYKMHQY